MTRSNKKRKTVKSPKRKDNSIRHCGKPLHTLKTASYGPVTVKASVPDKSVIQRNIIEGQRAFTQAAHTLKTVGVILPIKKSIPLYYTDNNHPGILIREYRGKKTFGKLINGKFSAIRRSISEKQKTK